MCVLVYVCTARENQNRAGGKNFHFQGFSNVSQSSSTQIRDKWEDVRCVEGLESIDTERKLQGVGVPPQEEKHRTQNYSSIRFLLSASTTVYCSLYRIRFEYGISFDCSS